MTDPLLVSTADDLGLQTVERVAHDRLRIELAPALLTQVDNARRAMLVTLEGGARVYGVNTGMGYLSSIDLDADAQGSHSRRLLLGRAVGSAPWLPPVEVRALMVVRLAEFLRGHSGVSGALCQFIADRLNDDFCPAVPAEGVGTAGEIQPLAHAFQTFVAVGHVLRADGGTEPAADALAARGAAPYDPGVKEGLALLAGAPAATGIGITHLAPLAELRVHALAAAAMSVDAINAPTAAFAAEHAALGADPDLRHVLAELARLLNLKRAESDEANAGHQAPVSFRVFPYVMAAFTRTLDRFATDLARHLAAVTDSPVYVDGRFLTSGAFHAIDIATGYDHLALALTHVAELSAQRTHRLMDARVTGLPAQLTPTPGAGAGLIAVHKRVVGVVNELKRLAAPVTVGLADTSLGQEDAQTFTFEAAARLRRVEDMARTTVACELLAARQARFLSGRRPSPGLARVADTIDAVVAPLEEDRPLGADIEAIVGLLQFPSKTNTRTA